jgi:hypothetical protein
VQAATVAALEAGLSVCPLGRCHSFARSSAGRSPPTLCTLAFGGECVSRSSTGAKLCVYLLRPAEGSDSAPAMDALKKLVDLLEQYYHPSNTGRCGAPPALQCPGIET